MLTRFISEISERQFALKKAAEMFELDASQLNYDRISILVQLCDLSTRVPDLKAVLFQAPDLEQTLGSLRFAAEQGRRMDRIKADIHSRFLPEVLRFDAKTALSEWDQLEMKWFLPKWIGQRRILKIVNRLAAPGKHIPKERLRGSLIDIMTYREEEQKLSEMKEMASNYLGHTLLWNEQGKWEAIEAACEWMSKLQELLVNWFQSVASATQARGQMADLLMTCRQNPSHGKIFSDITNNQAQIHQDEQELERLLHIDYSLLAAAPEAEDWHTYILDKAKHWVSNLDRLREWCTWRRVRSEAKAAGLWPLIEPYEQGDISDAQLEPAYERGLYQAIANYIMNRDETLRDFSGELFDDAIRRFKEADDQFTRLTQQEIVARLSSKVPNMTQEAAQSSEAGILQRAIRSGGRNISIRKLFEQIPNLLPRLTPCMLMSPISVAQYLDPSWKMFDLVIFDEASQVPTAQAVGALARGGQAIIVGDPKQLPPTSFFSKSNHEFEDEDTALQDMESILDDCLALGMPERHLSWHYRSRHESLIAFSNANYYENKLLTFPSPGERVSSVKWFPVEGFYDRGRTKQNVAEGEAVIAELIRRLKDPVLSQKSMGVVTFSSIQQTLIEDLLEDALKQNPELERAVERLPEPIFIKNLENVQGDERDIILFSVGYGPDAAGKISLNFGPLNRQGGWRRLNVAVSRARYEMLVFSTLHSHHLNASRISAQGVLGLKAFLEYAEKGKQALPASEASKQCLQASDLHRSMAEVLEMLGYDVDLHVGQSGFRVDIGIQDPDNTGQYMLGILLDGPMYQKAQTARDRNVLREQVLRQLGWNLIRVWSPDWWENRAGVIERTVQAINNAKEKKANEHDSLSTSNEHIHPLMETVTTVNHLPERDSSTLHEKGEKETKYIPCLLDPVSLGADLFHSPDYSNLIADQIRRVIQEEGPVSRSLLIKRILQSWGIARLGTKLDQRFTELLSTLSLRYTETDGVMFYWPEGVEPAEYDMYRVSMDDSQRRQAEDLPPEEIAAAVKAVLAAQISLPYEELMKQVAKTLGYSRSGNALEKAVERGILKAIERNDVLMDPSQNRVVAR